MVAAIASCTAAIARLDARIMTSSVASAWRRRAAWMGYTRALQLQAIEIDEIDVFSWGCELKIANRALRVSTVDIFEEFAPRSEEHTSELQSLMRISYAVFCLKKKNNKTPNQTSKLHTHMNYTQ